MLLWANLKQEIIWNRYWTGNFLVVENSFLFFIEELDAEYAFQIA